MHFSNCQVLRAKWRNGLNAAKHREMTNHKKNFIVVTGASSGFGALAARALAVLLRAQQGRCHVPTANSTRCKLSAL
jgi:hypothetical protein